MLDDLRDHVGTLTANAIRCSRLETTAGTGALTVNHPLTSSRCQGILDTMSSIAEWLDDVDYANQGLAAAKSNLDAAVRKALDAGATWEAIGGTLGITRQAAQQRFG